MPIFAWTMTSRISRPSSLKQFVCSAERIEGTASILTMLEERADGGA